MGSNGPQTLLGTRPSGLLYGLECVKTPGEALPMPCAHCEAEFTPKRTTGRFCSAKCRTAAWQARRYRKLATIEATLERSLAEVRALRRAHEHR